MSRPATLRTTSPTTLRKYYTDLVAQLRAKRVSAENAEDLASQAIMAGLNLDNLQCPEAWLYTTAFRKYLTLIRKTEVWDDHRSALEYHARLLRRQGEFPEILDALVHAEEVDIRKKRMQEALNTLPALESHILEENVVRGVKCKSLAERLGITVPALKSRLRRAKDRIRRYFKSHVGDGYDDAA